MKENQEKKTSLDCKILMDKEGKEHLKVIIQGDFEIHSKSLIFITGFEIKLTRLDLALKKLGEIIYKSYVREFKMDKWIKNIKCED